ncbi:hypothetical protein PFDG_05111 [Plasmodium falciparum Dd2]|uniref:Uncharacterized protein n=1 Tax=Plasmodium falciparum (isolate Dd2) TaxID=57267 RepID=A0A0L7M9R2_PLAF4|nr:hypothetical protein PFDG_05111 [Plasmodium falciparum Dd2]
MSINLMYSDRPADYGSSLHNEPLHLSIHCSGHLLMVAFTDKFKNFPYFI